MSFCALSFIINTPQILSIRQISRKYYMHMNLIDYWHIFHQKYYTVIFQNYVNFWKRPVRKKVEDALHLHNKQRFFCSFICTYCVFFQNWIRKYFEWAIITSHNCSQIQIIIKLWTWTWTNEHLYKENDFTYNRQCCQVGVTFSKLTYVG